MSISIGHIESLSGSASIISAKGESTVASQNMQITADSLVQTGTDAQVIIRFSDGSSMTVGPDQLVLIDKTVSDGEELAQNETQAEVNSLKAILAENPDLSVFEETASGEAVAVGGSSLIVDSIEKHNDNNGESGSSALDQFASNKLNHALDDDDTFGLVTDTTPALLSLDNILTNDNTPTITGTVSDPTADVVISVGGNDYTATNNGDGTWTLPVTEPMPDGTTEITVVATDPAGNETTETATVTVDTVDPVITIDPLNTNDTTPVISGTTDDDTAAIVVTIDGTDYDATNNGDGTWSLPVTDELAEGDTSVTVVATDPAGNSTTETETIIIDTTAPTVTLDTTPTNDTTPAISGTVDDPTATVIVTINGEDYTPSITDDGNGGYNWSLEDGEVGELPEGPTTVTVTATDPAGNETVVTDTVVIDTILDDSDGDNGGNIVTIDSITEDNGEFGNDFITNDPTLLIRGTYDNETENALTIKIDGVVLDAGAIVISDKQWSVDLQDQPFADGTHTIEAVVTDVAGNIVTTTQEVTIDTSNTSGPGGTGSDGSDATISLDVISGDNIINSAETTSFSITGNTTATDGSIVSIYVNGNLFDTAVASGGDFILPVATETFNAYPDGLYTVTAEVAADIAGNTVSSSQNVILDTSFVASIALDENLFEDSIINADEARSEVLYITGTTTAANGTLVTITLEGTRDGTPFSQTFAQTSASDGTFQVHVDPGNFANFEDGDYTIIATISDLAGNTQSDSQTITLDRTLDNGGDYVGDMITIDTITEDTGVSDSDFITSDNDLTISGTYNDEPGNSIVITVNGVEYSTDNSNITLPGDGTWSVDTGILPEGTTTITAVITDTSGNTETITQNVEIDTIADNGDGTTPAEITLDPISDGYINAQEAGNLVTLTGTSNVIGATVNITLNTGDFTSAIVQADGTYSVVVDTTTVSTYPDGDYIVQATIITDDAGNEVSAEQLVVLDTTLDGGDDYTGANVTIDAISEDTGANADDFITSDTTLVINGTFNAEAGNSVIIKVDSTIYDSNSSELTIDTANNTWSLDISASPLDQGVYTVTAIVKDEAGNSESVTQDISIVESTDLGIINLDEISGNYINLEESQSDLDITGVSTAIGQTVTFELNTNPLIIGGLAVTAVVQADGTFSITIPADTFSAYPDGAYDLKATVITVGGIQASDTEDVTLDRSITDPTGGTGSDGSDASIILENVSDGYINQQEASTGILLTGTTTAVEGTAISFVFETTTGDKYPVTTTANGQPITANADGTFDAFISLGDLTGVDNTTLIVTAEVIADKAGNISTSDPLNVVVDLSAGTLNDDTPTTPVYESALDGGSNPSLDGRTTEGNLFDNDTNLGDSTITSVSMGGVEATPWEQNSDILLLDTDSGVLFVAVSDTNYNGVDYSAGDYVYTLDTASTTTEEVFTYTVSDSAGNSSNSDLTITIVDDAPVVNEDGVVNKYLDSNTAGYATNLILTLDVSGSMNWDAEGDAPGDGHWDWFTWVDDYDPSTNRLNLAKDALKNLIDQYAELGDVNIQVITFSDTATASTMLDAENAKAYIDGLTADGGTMYDTAVAEAMNNPLDSYPDANTTQYYFISDGQPNSGGGLTYDEWVAWNSYIDNSPIDRTIAIGVGNNGSAGELGNIANEYGETIIIDSIVDLDGTLQQTVNTTTITGELTSFDADGTVAAVGADGGHILQLILYNQDGSVNQTVDYDAANPTQSITTEFGATLTVNFNDGSYTYAIDYNDTLAGQQESMNITVIDNDGDAVTNGIYFHLETNPNDNFAFSSTTAINGQDGFDTVVLSGAETLDFDNIDNLSNIEAIDMRVGDNDILNLSVHDIIAMTDNNNVLTIYGDSGDNVSKPVGSTETWTQTAAGVDDGNGHTVDAYSVSDGSNTVVVNIEQEIVVS